MLVLCVFVRSVVLTLTRYFLFCSSPNTPTGESRYITVSKKKGSGGGAEGAELPPILQLGHARDCALETYFSRRPPAAREVEAVMSSAVGGGMHAAAELVTQKRHKVGRREANIGREAVAFCRGKIRAMTPGVVCGRCLPVRLFFATATAVTSF